MESNLVTKLDQAFSIIIRYENATDNGYNTCFTCGKVEKVKNLHCGHFVGRSNKLTRWHKLNCKPQCYTCNCVNDGMKEEFRKNLNAMYGEGVAEMIEELASMDWKDSDETEADLRLKLVEFQKYAKELLHEKNTY